MVSSTKKASPETTYAYQRIETDIREKVRDGRLPAGTMLASRHNLAKEYGVALSTAQQAIANLIADGTLETSDRRGTFVAYKADSLISPPVARLTHGIAAATLGIVSTARIEPATSPDTGSLWARQAIRALEHVFASAGGTTRFFDRYPEDHGPYELGIDDANAISMTEAIQTLLGEEAAALAVVALCDGRDMSEEIVAAVDVEQAPVVYLSWHKMRPPLAQVYYDSSFAGYQAAQHLLRKGYSRLLFLAPFRENWLAERIESARDAVRHAGLLPETLCVYPDQPPHPFYNPDSAETWAYEAARDAFAERICGQDNTPSEHWGIIAPNDFTAYAVLRAAQELGKTPGVDFGLVGFDDDPRSCALGLTTVRPPIEAMGEEAGRLLLRALNGERNGMQICLRSQVIARASTRLSNNAASQPDTVVRRIFKNMPSST
jgi:DNA-binding LacI/PurR family transcriptional regulator/DNA-binding transcriptional regulator YhcF (GntR family)